ncbi:oxidoreductase [Methanomethylophilus alvi]|uniref:oxidoreductase n=1 Tax=Methanomethylophilus alvi TaxID=1291540 RepID=UPI0037DCE626
MDGQQMMHIEDGGRHSFWADTLPAGISVMRSFDRTVLIVWLLSLIASVAALGYMMSATDIDTYVAIQVLAAPFILVGFLYMVYRKFLIPMVAVIVLVVALWLLDVDSSTILFLAEIIFGAVGVACVVGVFQRLIFYKTLHIIRYINVKEKLGFVDRAVAFLFNVPPDLDTRNMEVDFNQVGKKFPWKDMFSTVMLSMAVGLFVWIYFSMNPALSDLDLTKASLSVFTVILYVPVIILPFSVFKSMNARIGTNYRDFKLYNGVVATIQRMAVPVVAVFLYLFYKIGNAEDVMVVMKFIALSAGTIFLVTLLTSLLYFYMMEASIVSDIGKKWNLFMPVPLLMSLKDEDPEDGLYYPATPERDESDLGDIEIAVRE